MTAPVAVGSWQVRRLRDSAATLHGEPVPEHPTRAVWVLEATEPALVLGSTQRDDVVDGRLVEQMGIAVVRRRSGGGAVLVVPGDIAWIDLIVPAGDPLWDDDVARSALWLGEAWRRALGSLGFAPTSVHEGRLVPGRLGRLVCFAALGSGEVVTPDGRKVVGISQRRTRAAARFQCAVYRRWDPDALARLVRVDDAGRRWLATAAVGVERSVDDLTAALLAQLPN